MRDSKALLLQYLASIRDPERAASLFAEDGVFELPFLRSLGVGPRYTGRGEITALLQQLLDPATANCGTPEELNQLVNRP